MLDYYSELDYLYMKEKQKVYLMKYNEKMIITHLPSVLYFNSFLNKDCIWYLFSFITKNLRYNWKLNIDSLYLFYKKPNGFLLTID